MALNDDLAYDVENTFFALTELAEEVTFRRRGQSSGGDTVQAIPEHLPDISEATADPLQRRAWHIPLNDDVGLSSDPQRGDKIVDSAGEVWTVQYTTLSVEGHMVVFTSIILEQA